MLNFLQKIQRQRARQSVLSRTESGQITQQESDILLHYLSLPPACDKNFLLTECRFVVFDTETTHAGKASSAELLSIGAVTLKDNYISIGNSFSKFIARASKVNQAEVHGILAGDLSGDNAISEKEALLSFLVYAGNAVLVAHHAAFDADLVRAGLKKYFGIPLLNPIRDTFPLAIRADGKQPGDATIRAVDYSLDAIAHRYRSRYALDLTLRHTALGDAMLTAELLLLIFRRLADRGVVRWKDL